MTNAYIAFSRSSPVSPGRRNSNAPLPHRPSHAGSTLYSRVLGGRRGGDPRASPHSPLCTWHGWLRAAHLDDDLGVSELLVRGQLDERRVDQVRVEQRPSFGLAEVQLQIRLPVRPVQTPAAEEAAQPQRQSTAVQGPRLVR